MPATNALQAALARGRARWWWQPDKWERLSTVADLCRPAAPAGSTVLDLGGRAREMGGLMPGRMVVSANVEQPCDRLIAPGPLPFANGEFDVVSNTDVLEHVPAGDRSALLGELVRVANRRVVVCFPCGSDTKDASERRLAETLEREYAVRFDFLDEHLTFGLPRVDDVVAAVREAAPDASVLVSYQDGVAAAERLLLDAMRAVRGRRPGAAARSARAWLVRRRPGLTTRQSENNNRAYVVIDLVPPAPGSPRRSPGRASASS